MAGLAVRAGDRVVTLGDVGPFVVGRAVDADLALTDPQVSRQHLILTGTGAEWSAYDMGGGTYRDGELVQPGAPIAVEPGTALMLGHPEQGVMVEFVSTEQIVPRRVQLDASTGWEPQPRPAAGGSSGRELSQSRVIRVGRRTDNDLVLPDPTVSGRHALLAEVAPGQYLVEDLRSTNGTYVDGVAVHRQEVGEGSVISFGTAFFRVTSEGLVGINDASADPDDLDAALVVSQLSYRIKDRQHRASGGKYLLRDVSFVVPPRSLVAVIGPSGAGKSTLIKAITGKIKPSAGQVRFAGLDTALFARSLVGRVGMVPQEDLVHRQLTARQALTYAAALRFTDDATAAERRNAVNWAIAELGLEEQADLTVRNLSGGQRKRVSVAMELITRPDMLLLDEPTSGLDPNLDLEVMEMLAELAHGTGPESEGRTVIVVTHSTENLNKADYVLLLSPGGRVAYFGPPEELIGHFSAYQSDVSWAAIYARLNAEPERAAAEFAASPLRQPDAESTPPPVLRRRPRATRRWFLSQAFTLLRRQTRLTLTDPYSGLFTIALPVAIALLTLLVRAPEGLLPAIMTDDVGKPRSLLIILAFGAVAMGLVPSVRQLVTERVIYQHEAGVGVRASAYLTSKVLLLGVVSAIQAFLLVWVALQVNPHPERGVFTDLLTEMWLACFVMSWTCAVLGLFLSAIVATAEQVMPLMVIALMLQLVLGGGVLPAISSGVSELSWLQPGRWGMAALATSLDFNTNITCHAEVLLKRTEDAEVNKKADEATDKANEKAEERAEDAGLPKPKAQKPEYRHTVVDCATVKDQDPLWTFDQATWNRDMAMVGAWFVVYLVGTWISLIRRARG